MRDEGIEEMVSPRASEFPGIHICGICGGLACENVCPTCERLADEYDTRYHAHRAAEIFGEQPRVADDHPSYETDTAIRGIMAALAVTVVAALISFAIGFAVRWVS